MESRLVPSERNRGNLLIGGDTDLHGGGATVTVGRVFQAPMPPALPKLPSHARKPRRME
jgi:hypothetical protein